MLKKLVKIYPEDYNLQRIQSNVDESINSIINSDFIRGNVLECNIGVTDTYIQHKLEKKYSGWVVIDRDTAAIVYTSSTVNNSPERQIILKASGAIKIKIYIF